MRKRSPLIAFLLSLIPGLGQIYAGAPSRGIALLVGLPLQALLLWLVDLASLNAWLVLVWLWSLFDAARLARDREPSPILPILLLVALNVYAGWRITEIAPKTLVQGLPRMNSIIVGLFQPDLLEPAVEEQAATATVVIAPRSAPGSKHEETKEKSAVQAAKTGAPHLVIEPAVIHPPQTVRAVGS